MDSVTGNLEMEEQAFVFPMKDQKLISTSQFLLLSFGTVGIYTIWWYYKEWRFFNEKDSLDIHPAMRAIFSIFFIYSLFTRILDYAKNFEYSRNYSPGLIFIFVILFNLCSALPAPFYLVSYGWVLLHIAPFEASNFAKTQDSSFKSEYQSTLSMRQVILLVFGVTCWLLIILELLAGETR